MFRKRSGKFLTLALTIAATAISSHKADAASSESYIGTIFPTAAMYCPQKTVEAQGQILAISDFEALYSVIGTAYGGDGRSSFGLPDLRGRVVVGAGTGPGLTPTARGLKNGAQFVTLTTENLPAHTHTTTFNEPVMQNFRVSTGNSTTQTPNQGNWIAAKKAGPRTYTSYIPAADKGTTVKLGNGGHQSSTLGEINVENSGNSDKTGINTPTITIRYCVVTQGVYPPHG